MGALPERVREVGRVLHDVGAARSAQLEVRRPVLEPVGELEVDRDRHVAVFPGCAFGASHERRDRRARFR